MSTKLLHSLIIPFSFYFQLNLFNWVINHQINNVISGQTEIRNKKLSRDLLI